MKKGIILAVAVLAAVVLTVLAISTMKPTEPTEPTQPAGASVLTPQVEENTTGAKLWA